MSGFNCDDSMYYIAYGSHLCLFSTDTLSESGSLSLKQVITSVDINDGNVILLGLVEEQRCRIRRYRYLRSSEM
jgi:hypothetical protein